MSSDILSPLFYGSTAEAIFSSSNQLQKMLLFEVALSGALEDVGIAPPGTALRVVQASAAFPSQAQVGRIAQSAVGSGNIAIPFVKELTASVHEQAGDAAIFIHFGATSQDVLDTALVLQLREFLTVLSAALEHTCRLIISLTEANQYTVMAGRTWMQQGPPILFAQKSAGWLAALLRHRKRITVSTDNSLTLQFGGAIGTLASLGTHGEKVAAQLAERLNLKTSDIPWHSERDSLAETATCCGLLTGTLGKIARDLSLMMQTEVAEAREHLASGEGGSSTMPHKQNPVNAALILSAAISVPGLVATMLSAMPQEHERGLGGWHAEWTTLPEICKLTYGALQRTISMLSQLQIDREQMQSNLALLHGAAMAEAVTTLLAPKLGRIEAHHLMEGVCRTALEEHKSLEHCLQSDPIVIQHLSADEISHALNPANYLGQSHQFIRNVLSRAKNELPPESDDATS